MRQLTDNEVRVLGSLIEKEVATPEYYPLTLNALTNACNQKSNRYLLMALEETDVVRALDGLRELGFATKVMRSDARVPKYDQVFTQALDLERDEVAVLCELMIRGPQTAGELKVRTERLHKFASAEDLQRAVDSLAQRPDPLVVKLPRKAGHKEQRYAQTLGAVAADAPQDDPLEPAARQVKSEDSRIAALEAAVNELRQEVEGLKGELEGFRKQFE